jgi:hypothetical protein
MTHMSHGPSRLGANVAHTFILAYRENTEALEQALREEGLSAEVIRPTYTSQELTYSRAIRCLLNHGNAWRRARDMQGMSLIVEADFVPCRGMAQFPLPFSPELEGDGAWAFLYSAGPRMLRCRADGSLQGHSATSVAYVITPLVAGWLVEYLESELIRHGDLTRYSLWDTQFQWHIMGKGGKCFMPFRNFGEHGGRPNTEHHREGVGLGARLRLLTMLGIGRNHHADVLYGPLKFIPEYAHGSRLKFLRTRLEAKVTGWLKLLSGRVVMADPSADKKELRRMRWLCFRRLCSSY